ncbi:glyoxalase [Luteococcus sp. H138]|uniref:VOC family protein n=1 Tax=unclassified Luteococcus TaxID=2639923 RepID=UPI00313C5489
MSNPVHHIELWTDDLAGCAPSLDWLLPRIGWLAEHDPAWPAGRVWRHASGAYLVLEQSPAVTPGGHDRMRPGLNHLAFRVPPGLLTEVRREAPHHGWRELFAERYPWANGNESRALFLENGQGFEVELVAA